MHAMQQHYVLNIGNRLLATMIVVMRRRMNIMVAVMVRYLTAAKGGVRMGSEQLLLGCSLRGSITLWQDNDVTE